MGTKIQIRLNPFISDLGIMLLWLTLFYIPFGMLVGCGLHFLVLIFLENHPLAKETLLLISIISGISGILMVLMVWFIHSNHFTFGPKYFSEIFPTALATFIGFALLGAWAFSYIEIFKEGFWLIMPKLKIGMAFGIVLGGYLNYLHFHKK